MAMGFEHRELGKKQFDYDPKKVEEHRVTADTLELRLRTPASYAPYCVEVSLGTKANLKGITTTERAEVWEGEIPLQREPEFGPDRNYIKGKEPEKISEEEALRRYKAVCTQIENGNYKVHKFDSGKIQVELTDLTF